MCVEITFWTIVLCVIVFWKRQFFKMFIYDCFQLIITISKAKQTKISLIVILNLIFFWYFCSVFINFFYLIILVFPKWEIFSTTVMLALLLNAFLIVNTQNAIRGLIMLIGFFINSAIVLLFLGAKYIGLNLILIYLGAILILLVFVLMLLNTTTVMYNKYETSYKLILILMWFKLICVLNYLFNTTYFLYKKNTWNLLEPTTNTYADVFLIANTLYTEQIAVLLITTVILFIALVVSITLTTFKHNYI